MKHIKHYQVRTERDWAEANADMTGVPDETRWCDGCGERSATRTWDGDPMCDRCYRYMSQR